MSLIATTKTVSLVYKFRKPIIISIISFFALIFIVAGGILNPPAPSPIVGGGGNAKVSPEVQRWESVIRSEAKKNGIESYTPLIMALVQQESGGRHLDIMQSSESLGLGRNAITDPVRSIEVGVAYFKDVLEQSNHDVKTALQSYNFGNGFIAYANKRGGYSEEVAQSFSSMMAAKQGWRRYGDVKYVEHVMRYYEEPAQNAQVASAQVASTGGQIFDVNAVYSSMAQYLGDPYVWGGANPATGFDCSGYIQWNFKQQGINLPRTAQLQYNAVTRIDESQLQPGDLVFFAGTYEGPTVTHIGMYIGNGKMINSSSSGIQIADAFKGYWGDHYYASGRITG